MEGWKDVISEREGERERERERERWGGVGWMGEIQKTETNEIPELI
jgi:hypothetical protein